MQECHGLFAIIAAHVDRRLQASAYCWTSRITEQLAAIKFIQLHAAHTGRLPVGHAGNRMQQAAQDGRQSRTGEGLFMEPSL